jgi:hypothetical protein
LDNQKEPLIQVYPNPGEGFYRIETSEPLHSIQISDLSGKIITAMQEPAEEFLLNARPGIYLALIQTKSGYRRTLRLIHQ